MAYWLAEIFASSLGIQNFALAETEMENIEQKVRTNDYWPTEAHDAAKAQRLEIEQVFLTTSYQDVHHLRHLFRYAMQILRTEKETHYDFYEFMRRIFILYRREYLGQITLDNSIGGGKPPMPRPTIKEPHIPIHSAEHIRNILEGKDASPSPTTLSHWHFQLEKTSDVLREAKKLEEEFVKEKMLIGEISTQQAL